MTTPTPPAPALRLADGVLVINLDQRPERLERFAAMAALTRVLDGWQRIPAVNGVELPGYGQRPWFASANATSAGRGAPAAPCPTARPSPMPRTWVGAAC